MVQSDFKNRVFQSDNDRTDTTSDSRQSGLSQAELLDFLQRSLAGEPFPVSAPGARTAPEATVPLALRIREILRTDDSRPAAPEMDEPAQSMAIDEPAPVQPASAESSAVDAAYFDADLQPPTEYSPSLSEPQKRAAISWGSAAFILAVTAGSALVPMMLATPPHYAAQSRLQFLGAARTTPGFVEATLQRITSQHALAQVVTRLKLDHDAEFSGGKATAYSVVRDLLTDSGAAADSFSRAQLALKQRLTIAPDLQSGAIALVARSEDPAKSARIANLLADIAVRDAATNPLASVPGAAELALESDRKRFDDATSALANFKAAAGDEKIAAATALMASREALGNRLATANAAVQAASIRLTAAKSVRMADVLDGAISPDLGSPAALEDLRNRYAAARSTLSQLSTQLGPRHPRLIAAQSSIDTLGASILAEIRKLVVASDAEVKTTTAEVKQLKDRLAELDGQKVDVDLEAFRRLQENVETARQAYDAALTASEEAAPQSKPSEVPLALTTPAVPAAAPIDDDMTWRSLRSALGGLAIALALVAARLLTRRSFRRPSDDHHAVDFDKVDLLVDFPQDQAPVRVPLDQPQKCFDASVAVANDRLEPVAGRTEPETALAAIIDDVALLRERVANYASRRQAAGR
ncbi:hypothetical protein [Rhizobium sp. L245/93]|uniref:hypothetical protein n=1 Tax=Rhizobium sp. L245/93 TaxID=2819998 RepID=UPI001ADA6F71|nr:hypothetical protein [Rhizobium sp. L245/93]MBO9167544.1 hypothetical protein [Rhizobium sp. L245/93]